MRADWEIALSLKSPCPCKSSDLRLPVVSKTVSGVLFPILCITQYLDLDRDQNGLLNKIELLRYPGFSQATRLTSAFVDRVFEESITYRLPSETAEEDESLPEAEMVRMDVGV